MVMSLLHKELMFVLWCKEFGKDPGSCESGEQYKDYLKDAEVHCGDCTKDSCSCIRCNMQGLEVDSQNAINYLEWVFKDKDEPLWKKLLELRNRTK